MSEYFRYLPTALMFFTRLPGIHDAPYDDRAQREALKFFPLIGWGVGAVGAVVLAVGLLWLPASVAVILALAAMVLATGAMHEDGLADSIDAFGGAFESERVLEIMKDSRLGVYGAIALILVFALKITALIELVGRDAHAAVITLMFVQAASRWAVLPLTSLLDYVQSSADSKSRPMVGRRMSLSSVAYSGLWVVLPLLLFGQTGFWLALVTGLITSLALARYFRARIGGYSGDCLGATQQICEVVMYLTILTTWISG